MVFWLLPLPASRVMVQNIIQMHCIDQKALAENAVGSVLLWPLSEVSGDVLSRFMRGNRRAYPLPQVSLLALQWDFVFCVYSVQILLLKEL